MSVFFYFCMMCKPFEKFWMSRRRGHFEIQEALWIVAESGRMAGGQAHCQHKHGHISLVPWVAGSTAVWVLCVEAVHLPRGETLVNCRSNRHLPPRHQQQQV